MELVRTSQGLYHLSTLQVIQAYSTTIFAFGFLVRRILFFLLILETWDRVNDVFYLFRRRKWHAIFIHRFLLFLIVLLLIVHILTLSLPICEILAILRHSIEEKLLVLPSIGRVGIALLGARLLLAIEHPIEVHVHAWVLGLELREHVLNVAHDAL